MLTPTEEEPPLLEPEPEIQLSADQLRRIHVALDQAKGNTRGAAALLGLSAEGLEVLISRMPELASYRPGVKPPSEREMLTRKPLLPARAEKPQVPASPEAKLDASLRAIGISGGALDEAKAFTNFGRHHFADMRHFVGGGMAKLFADLMEEIRDVRREISTVSGDDVERQKVLREDRSRLVGHAIGVYDRVREAAHTEAVLELKRKESQQEGGKKPKGALGAPPLSATPSVAMSVQGNVTVVSPAEASQAQPQQPR